jgi:hypothetical protein
VSRSLALQALGPLPPRCGIRGARAALKATQDQPDPHRRLLSGRDRLVRKELAERGFDAGAQTVHFHIVYPGRLVPSASTIHRVLVARGFFTPEPRVQCMAQG